MDRIVMDGTALGILGTLPKFWLHTKVVKAVPRISAIRYVMKNPKLRGFIDSILRSAKTSGMRNIFHVLCKGAL